MSTPTVSVIIAVHNGASHINEAIDSVLSQTFQSFEIIVVDDGSTDNTKGVLQSYANAGKIRYIYQENRGASAARNRGLKIATGTYIKFLDCDDILYSQQLEFQVSDLDREQSDVSYSAYDMLYTNKIKKSFSIQGGRRVSLASLIERNNGPLHAYLIKKDALMRVGGFDETLSYYEDIDLWLRLKIKGAIISTVSYVGCCYCIWDGSMSSNIELMFAQRCQVFEKLNQVLLDNFTLATEDVRDKLLWENINLIQEHLVRKHNIKRYSKYTLQMTNLLYSLSKQGLKLWLFKLLGVKNFFRLQYVKYCLTKKNYRLMLMNEEIRYRNNNKNDCNKGMNIPLKVMNKLRGLFYILYFSLINFLVNRRGIWILMYHRINDTLTPSDLVISTKEFRKQMWYLRKYCNVISLQDVYDIYVGKKEMKRSRRPQVVITIDDGYRDNYQNAYPILSKFGLPATIFLVTGFIGTDKKLPRYQNMPSPDMLNWDEVRTMNNGYIKFCPHTESHSHLPELGYLEQIKEVKNSMDALVKNLSAERESFIFSYTYGEYNKVTLDVLRELGMKLSVTANRGINTLKDAPLELQRIGVDGREDLVNFMRKFITDVRST